MENLLREYLERAFRDPGSVKKAIAGPVVTISREFGCPSKQVAQLLTDTLNRRPELRREHRWRFINKELVESAARELNVNKPEIDYLMSTVGKGIVEDIMASFAHGYVSHHRIRNTITTIVKGLAGQGNIIIVGRGGAGVLHDCPNALHIRLHAPLEWRIPEICKLRSVDEEDALKIASETDRKRTALIELLYGKKFHPYLFDMHLNCSRLSLEEIVHATIGMMEVKGMIGKAGRDT